MSSPSYEYNSKLNIVVSPASEPQCPISVKFLPGVEHPCPGEPTEDMGSIFFKQSDIDNLIVIVSLGKAKIITMDTFRQAGGALARWLFKSGVKDIDLDITQFDRLGPNNGLLSLVEGLWLGEYKFNLYKTGPQESQIITIHLKTIDINQDIAEKVAQIGMVIRAINTARDWSHEPANSINPETLSIRVQDIANKFGIKCIVIDKRSLEEMKAGAILAVGKGSSTPARMIILEYSGQPQSNDHQPIVLVGKAITFDSGGYSIKDSTNIQGMKYDKIGGIMVMAVLQAAAQLKINTPVIGIITAAENMVSENAYRPDDIITTLSGKTVEIVSTDAEGRLLLADALTYAQQKYQPRAIIDLATLTGGVVTALGHVRAGVMANDDSLFQELFEIGEEVHERLWRLPLDDDYLEATKGDDADLKNSGGRDAHPIMGGIFLKQFVKDSIPWAHIDIAGVADMNKDTFLYPKGATGFGIRLLVEYLKKK